MPPRLASSPLCAAPLAPRPDSPFRVLPCHCAAPSPQSPASSSPSHAGPSTRSPCPTSAAPPRRWGSTASICSSRRTGRWCASSAWSAPWDILPAGGSSSRPASTTGRTTRCCSRELEATIPRRRSPRGPQRHRDVRQPRGQDRPGRDRELRRRPPGHRTARRGASGHRLHGAAEQQGGPPGLPGRPHRVRRAGDARPSARPG